MRGLLWLGIAVLLLVGTLAVPDSTRLTLQLRDNSTGVLVNATRSLTANLTLSGADCAANPATLFSNTSNVTSDSVGGVSLRLTPSGLNHTDAYQWCLYRNDTQNTTVNTTAPLDPVSQAQYAARVSANGTLDDSDLNITRHNASFNRTWVDGLFARAYMNPFTDASLDLGNTSLRFRDLYVSRNLTDGTYWGSIQNFTEAARYTLNATRAGLLLNSTGSHNVSLSQLAALANTSRTLLNSSQESDYVNRTGSNMTGNLNMTGNAIGNVSNITLGPHMITWNISCAIIITNGTGQDNFCL